MTDMKDKTVKDKTVEELCEILKGWRIPHPVVSEFASRLEEAQQKIVAQQYEINHRRNGFERAVLLLSGIHALLYPPICVGPDGKGWAFNSPDVHALIQGLSDRVRELPDKISELKSAYSEANDAEVAAKALEERAEYYELGDRPEWVAEICRGIALNLREKAAEYRAKAKNEQNFCTDNREDICGFCGKPGADKIPHPMRWPNENSAGTEYVHADCEDAECRRAHSLLSDKERESFLRTI